MAPEPDAAGEVDSEAETLAGAAAGRILGDRYQMRELLGRGGMGEVWRAFDLKLRVDVALKAVRPDRQGSDKARDLLRQEVRSAREVVSPNVCRIFDLVVEKDRELVSMEYVDGETLAQTLRTRGPLEVQEAREIASQFLSGLEAIHSADLVHRDFKPENVMLTRAGRVVVMDFGLARGLREGTGTVAGTPAYMAPEQSRGEGVDGRADVWAAGVVLAEMLSVGGSGSLEARRALWKGVRETPPRIPEGPWAGVLRRAVDPDPGVRPSSARALSQALEEVTLRLPGFEEKRPYPGLLSFTEEDAEYFFGREAEVEDVWKKLKRPRLLALIGPSGTGKSSFIRAGLLPALPSGWAAVVATPGHRPFQTSAQALVPAFSGEPEVMQEFLRFEEPDVAVSLVSRWRKRHEQALVVVDQFEELFTLNPPEVQGAFAELLGRLVLEADVHVLLSLRDDFLFQCHGHEALTPILNELTLLGPLSESGLRRALVQPALACGYRFEDEALVEEMVGEVGQERGALPLLAFAASRLWEKRDRGRGLLTREAYEEIGGVAGALAQHAESTLERIGTKRTPVARELLRNLVTAQGTRAVREREDLLSVFGEAEGTTSSDPVWTESGGSGVPEKVATRTGAAEVLGALVDARLLTSFERPGEESGESRQEIEIVHESLLSRWPRLVRWQTQDADGAQLRDQLRQAAQAWEDRGRPEDLLWSGTAYRDLAVWRERYPGGLSATEEAFAQAARHVGGRRRRRRRLARGALVSAAAMVAIVTSVLWQRSEAEVRQREAAELLALGRLRLEGHPAAALAHALASLERADSGAARRFAVESLWRGPMAFVLTDPVSPVRPRFSPDGRWLAVGGTAGLALFDGETGKRLQLASAGEWPVGFSPDAERLVTTTAAAPTELYVWSLPGAHLLETWPATERRDAALAGDRVLTLAFDSGVPPGRRVATVRSRPIGGGAERTLGDWATTDLSSWEVGPDGEWMLSVQGGNVARQRLGALEEPPEIVGRHEGEVAVWAAPWKDRLVTADDRGEVRIWNAATRQVERTLRSSTGARKVEVDPGGRLLAAAPAGVAFSLGSLVVFDLQAPRGADPATLLNDDPDALSRMSFHPSGQWLASGHAGSLTLWNLAGRRSMVFRGQGGPGIAVAFTPEGSLVASSWNAEGTVRLWPLFADRDGEMREMWSQEGMTLAFMMVSPDGRFALAGDAFGGTFVVLPLDGAPPEVRSLKSVNAQGAMTAPSVDPSGRRVAVGHIEYGRPEAGGIRVLDLVTGDETLLRSEEPTGGCEAMLESFGSFEQPLWLPDGRLVSEGAWGLRIWNLRNGSSRQLRPCRFDLDSPVTGNGMLPLGATLDSKTVVSLVPSARAASSPSVLSILDTESGVSVDFPDHGTSVLCFALDPTGAILVTGGEDGVVRVGRLEGGEPHLLFGHSEPVNSVAVSPDGKWIASAGDDETIRLWPMPDVDELPLHRWPHATLLAKLRTLTNLRVVPDAGGPTGHRVEPGPFSGWAEPPEW